MNSEFFPAEQGAAPQIVSISELNRMVGRLLEQNVPLLWVAGEISNLTRAASGHWYFLLKDRDAQVRCVMFRKRNQLLDWEPREGDHIEARAAVGLYAARGEFQLTLEAMRRAGAGLLYEAFLRLKAKLLAEGLFEPERKRALPDFVRALGVITSPQAAALRDVLSTLRRRAPHVRIVVYPTPVQGKDAPPRILQALNIALERAERLGESDVLLLVRGGGSIEDLWAYNDEALARAIAAARVPIISGIGHETDFTIADFVADVRAATPTAAAELAAVEVNVLRQRILAMQGQSRQALTRRLESAEQGLDDIQRRLRSPRQRLADAQGRLVSITMHLQRAQGAGLSRLMARAQFAIEALRRSRPDGTRALERLESTKQVLIARLRTRLTEADNRLSLLTTRLGLLNPRAALDRGYAIVSDARGRLVTDAAQLQREDRLRISLGRGTAIADVVQIELPES